MRLGGRTVKRVPSAVWHRVYKAPNKQLGIFLLVSVWQLLTIFVPSSLLPGPHAVARRIANDFFSMLKRVAVATVFANGASVLLLDEPFGALDYVTKRQLHDVLLKLWAQSDGKNRRTVLFVTHDVDEALTLADRILVLHSGRLVDDLGISVLRPRTADSLLLAGDDASKARVSRPPWPRRRNGARGSHGRLGAGMIKSFTRAVHRAPTSLLVLAGMAGFWQVLSMIFRAEALPGEPMVPGWRYRGRVGLEGSCAVAYSRLRLYPEGRTNFGLQLHSANERDGPKTSLSGRK
jgi:hypothetical protein